MPWARASALERHIACQAASYLPRWDRASWNAPYLGLQTLPTELGPTKDWSAADWGTAAHSAKAGTGVDPWQEAFTDELREKYWPSKLGQHEAAFAYDCDTGTAIRGPVNLAVSEMDAWKNAQSASCIVGTSDWVAELPSGEPWIDDLKTGWRRPPIRTEAMLFYGLCIQRLTDSDSVRLSISHLPRSKAIDVTKLQRRWLQVTRLDLDDFANDCHIAWRRTRGAKLLPIRQVAHPGDHCGYCPSNSICPAHTKS